MNDNLQTQTVIPLSSRIVYQDASCVVVNKLKGEVVEGAARGMTDLQKDLRAVLPGDVELVEAVNRLDVPVTGCALFALTQDSLSFLNSAFTEKGSLSVKKIYWAVMEKPSRPLENKGSYIELTHWIETNTKVNKSFAYYENAAGSKKASLRYKITGEGINYLFALIELITGRHHQIRAQFAAEEMYIKGDLKYGAKRSEKDGGIRLHWQSLTFPDPLNRTEFIHVTANPPVMDSLWTEFSKCV